MKSQQTLAHESRTGLGDRAVRLLVRAAERGRLPDAAIRMGIREICRRRLRELADDPEVITRETERFIAHTSRGPIAVATEDANNQHYQVPSGFFELVLGPALKYSCCYWPDEDRTLAEAEKEALERTCANAELADGQRILELGCGWGSLTLHMAARYPEAAIKAVSNSSRQGEFIVSRARERNLDNIEVVTCDINELDANEQLADRFDRVVSVEMFEHMRNHARLMERIAGWLVADGKLFVHLFCSGQQPYAFEDRGADDWMARNFFTGGVMPSDDLLLRYQEHLVLSRQWRWSGQHYRRTADAWLGQLDAHRDEIERLLARLGARDPGVQAQRWRIFFMACSELFGFGGGNRWWVSHYLFDKR